MRPGTVAAILLLLLAGVVPVYAVSHDSEDGAYGAYAEEAPALEPGDDGGGTGDGGAVDEGTGDEEGYGVPEAPEAGVGEDLEHLDPASEHTLPQEEAEVPVAAPPRDPLPSGPATPAAPAGAASPDSSPE
jgi:hypothetical protein